MINLRYHIVSLVAVFLALALGILIGSTVLDQGVVRLLETERNLLANHRDRLAEENESVNEELALWERFGRSIVPELTRGRLTDQSVTLLIQQESDPDLVDEVIAALEHAEASIAGRVSFTAKWGLQDQPSREQLALVLGADASDTEALLRDAAARLAARLAAGGDPAVQTDLLQAMSRNGFLTLTGVDGTDFPPPTSLVVLVGAAEPSSQPPRDEFLVPLLHAMQDQLRVVLTEPLEAGDTVRAVIRRDDVLAGTVSTVDHGDTLLGELAMVFALRDAAAGLPARHYGIGDGASSIVPDVDR